MSPLLKSVEQVGFEAIQKKRIPSHITPADFFSEVNELKNSFSRLINTPTPDQIALIPSVSYGIATVTKNIHLKKGEKVIVLDEQFPSNYYSWKRLTDEYEAELVIIKRPLSSTVGSDWNEAILNSIDEKVKVVSMAHVHWVDGTLFRLEEISAKCKKVGALLIVDGTQSVGALPFDIEKIKPDALICAGYKWLLGPYSQGVAYFGEYFDNGMPIEENWINRYESEDFAGLVNYNDGYQSGAFRYSVGEQSNFILVPMLNEAIQNILNWGVDTIQSYCKELITDTLGELTDAGYKIESPEFRSNHLFGVRVSEVSRLDQIKTKIQNDNISVSIRGDAIRLSPHLYNDHSDVSKLKNCLLA
ncbi:MAG: aminotransferase class V-fold PLP-dependent enzyme [Fulvivirga sp.]|uniref:aminotransferase class V-fold PLP-dependent enzyme n=1 Tax=Fulvivirga sp. TaxID=1931237 RepID=UPI0032EC03E5